MKKLIVISDWANDTLSCQEFRSVVEGYLKDPFGVNINFVSSTPSTIHCAFLIQQVIETEVRYGRPQETIIFENVDVRLKKEKSEFLIANLINGIYVCGPNAEYNFSLITKEINKLFVYRGDFFGSQFRSRDFYGRICAHLMDEMEEELELEETNPNIIPRLQGFYISHIDNFGNIKTTIPLSFLKGKYQWGDEVEIKIGKVTKKARLVKGLFDGEPGILVIYPGSSGKKDDPYLEISVWVSFSEKDNFTGRDFFHNPLPGMSIDLK